MTLTTFALQSLLSLVLGSLIGVERQWHRRLVDLKTSALVSLGATLFMMCAATPAGWVEPMRMAAQIVTGIGFIGGGLLFREGTHTRGINTAATLWCAAAIGTLCGLGRDMEAVLGTVVLVAANTLLRDVAHRLQLRMGLSDSATEQLAFDIECKPADAPQVREQLERVLVERHGELRSISEIRTRDATIRLNAVAAFESTDLISDIEATLAAAEDWKVISVSWRRI
jgi:putative Mg2+ transporter-C (MgtC) family protein